MVLVCTAKDRYAIEARKARIDALIRLQAYRNSSGGRIEPIQLKRYGENRWLRQVYLTNWNTKQVQRMFSPTPARFVRRSQANDMRSELDTG